MKDSTLSPFAVGIAIFIASWFFGKDFLGPVWAPIVAFIAAIVSIFWMLNERAGLKLDTKYMVDGNATREVSKVARKLNRIVKKVERENLHRLITDLYYESIRYLPKWYEIDKERVPSSVESARFIFETARGDVTVKRAIEVVLKGGRKYVFVEHGGGMLELFADKERVFAINIGRQALVAFREGGWIAEFRKLQKEFEELEVKTIEELNVEFQKEIVTMAKRNFGIEEERGN